MTKEQALAELRLSRQAIARDTAALKEEFDIAAKIRKSIRRRPLAWLGGSALLGWIAAGPKTRTRTVTKYVNKPGKASESGEVGAKVRSAGLLGLAVTVFRFALPMLKPALSAYAARRLGEMAEKMMR